MQNNNIKLVEDIERFKDLKEEWDLLYNCALYPVFQSFSFNYAAWQFQLSESKKNQLKIVVIFNDNQLVAIFPFYLDSRKCLRFIADIHVDFCDCLTNNTLIDFQEVYSFLEKRIGFKSIRLINIVEDSNIYTSLTRFNFKNKLFLSSTEYSTLYIEKGEFPYNVPSYRSHQKHRINKAAKKHCLKEHVLLTFPNDAFPESDLIRLRDIMILRGIRDDNFLDNNFLLFIRKLYNSNLMMLGCLKHEGQIQAINIVLKRLDGELLFWIDLFNQEQMINIANYINLLQKTSFEDNARINFGRGRYFYKVSNFAPCFKQLYSVYLFPNSFSKMSFIIFEQFRQILRLIYKKIR